MSIEVGERVWAGIRPEHLKIDVGQGDGESIGEAVVESLVSDGLALVVGLRARERAWTTHLLAGRGLARRLRIVDPGEVHACAIERDLRAG